MKVAFAALALFLASGAYAQDHEVVATASLPLDGSALDVAQLSDRGGPYELRLHGTLSFAVDGSERDLGGTYLAGRRVARAPMVSLPAGAVIVSADPATHTYVVRIPKGGDARVFLRTQALAREHLLTSSEAAIALSGAIEVALLAPEGAAIVALERTSPRVARSGVALAIAALVSLLLAGGAILHANRGPHRALFRRAQRAARAITAETDALGPAFAHVARFAERLLDTATTAREHYLEAERAKKRARRLGDGRQDAAATIDAQTREAIERLTSVAERLEHTAIELASQRAAQSRADDVDALIAALELEVGTARDADEEARAATRFGRGGSL